MGDDPQEILRMARAIKFPVIIKAAGGGGGRGMRVVHSEAGLLNAVAMTKAEAQAAEAPEQWSPYKFKTRRVIDRTFKFSLVYLHNENEIYVVAVAPMRRKPVYWKARLGDA